MKKTKEIFFNYDYLRATVIHTAKQDVRFYLRGVYIGDGYMAATCGHKLIVIEDDCFNGCDFIIPRENIEFFIKKNGNNPMSKEVCLTILDNGFNLLSLLGNYEYFKFIDGKFPNISRVDISRPEKSEGHPMFNIGYLADFLKSYKILNGKNHMEGLNILSRGETNSAYIDISENAHGVLMPMRV